VALTGQRPVSSQPRLQRPGQLKRDRFHPNFSIMLGSPPHLSEQALLRLFSAGATNQPTNHLSLSFSFSLLFLPLISTHLPGHNLAGPGTRSLASLPPHLQLACRVTYRDAAEGAQRVQPERSSPAAASEWRRSGSGRKKRRRRVWRCGDGAEWEAAAAAAGPEQHQGAQPHGAAAHGPARRGHPHHRRARHLLPVRRRRQPMGTWVAQYVDFVASMPILHQIGFG
jgi:hypothetical protein